MLDKRVIAYNKTPKKLQERREEEETKLMFENDKPTLNEYRSLISYYGSSKYNKSRYDNFYYNNIDWYYNRLRGNANNKSEAKAYINRVRSSKISPSEKRKTYFTDMRHHLISCDAYEQTRIRSVF